MTETPVWVLTVEVGRAPDDGLPEGAEGAAILCYCAAKDERLAVDDTVRLLREAGMAPLEVSVEGTSDELVPADDPDAPEHALVARARAENAVIVADILLLSADDDPDIRID